MNAQSKITKANPVADALLACGDDGREAAPWGVYQPSKFDWQVLIYGGICPRSGFPLDAQIYQYFRDHYTAVEAMLRANRGAWNNHRTRFALRDTDGTVIYNGPVLNALGLPVYGELAA